MATVKELDALKIELQKITYSDNYRQMIGRISKWTAIHHQILILKYIVYHYRQAQALLKGNYKYKNPQMLDTRIALMGQNNQIMNDFISRMIGLGTPANWHYDDFRHLPRQHFGTYKPDMVHQVLSELHKNGYAVFPRLLPIKVCDSILSKLEKLKYCAKYQEKYINGIQLNNPVGLSHWVDDQREVFYISEIQELLRDPVMLSICQLYLQTTPINIQTNFWWSVRNLAAGKKDFSQMFHQDQDDVKFIKIFIYLNDVTKENGPHVYVKGSINNRMKMPKGYKISNRLTDDWVKTQYGAEAVTSLTGPKGTILFGNTNAIHKGQALARGHRYLLQLEFGCSLSWFEQSHSDLAKNKLQPEMNEFMDKHPIIFLKYRRL